MSIIYGQIEIRSSVTYGFFYAMPVVIYIRGPFH